MGYNQYDAKCKVFLVRVSGLAADAGLGVAMIRSRGRHHPDTGSGTMLSTLAIANSVGVYCPLSISRCPQCSQGRCPLSLSRCPRCWRRAAPGDTGRPTVCSRSYWLDTGQGDWVTTTSPDTANFSWLLHRVAVMSVIHRFIVFQDSTPPLYYLWCCIIDFKLNVSRQLPFDQRIWLLLLLKWHLEKFLQELGNCKRALSFQMIDFYWPDKI